jgi:hypothetical protein
MANEGLVLSIDVANQKCISPSAARGYNSAPQFVRNLITSSDTITSTDTLRLGNLSYFTAFAIDYPEGNYGGDAAARHGITPGFNVRTGTKTFSFGRALNHGIWDEITQTWVKTQVYDSYVGTAAVDSFVADYYNNIKQYPKATHIVAGSHRDSFHTSAQYEILRDLGAPSNVDSIINFSSPEWILIGKPGLGADKGAWSFQNYSTNPAQVAHMNFALPIFGNTQNYLSFDSTSESIDIPERANLNNLSYTYAFWIRRKVGQSASWLQFLQRSTSDRNPGIWFYINEVNRIHFSIKMSNGTNTSVDLPGFFQNEWHHFTATVEYDGTNTIIRGYTDGILTASTILNNLSPILGTGSTYVGRQLLDLGNLQIYNRALSASEVQDNFNALRGRYGI